MLIDVGDTRLHVTERGAGDLALFLLHGGPGLDHTMFGSYLDALGDRCRLLLVDERGTGRSEPAAPETWALAHHAADVEAMAGSLGLERYAVLGHSYGAFIALQHAVDFPGRPAATVVSSGIPDARFLAHVEQELAAFEPDVLRAAATEDYGAIAVEDRLGEVAHPVLVLAGRQDRTCPVAAAEAMAEGLPDSELVVFEHSGHMAFIEENDAYLAAVLDFLERRAAA